MQKYLFVAMVLLVWGGANTFLYVQSLPLFGIPRLGPWLRGVFIALALSFLVGMRARGCLGGVLEVVGTMWLAFMLYLTMLFVVVLLLRLFNRWFGFAEWMNFGRHTDHHRAAVVAVYAMAALIVLAGHVNAMLPRVVHLKIGIDRPLAGPLRVVAVSDIHLGNVIGARQLRRLVRTVNAQHPDVVLLVGDTFDQQLEPVLRSDMGRLFGLVEARHGVVAVTGNHDYFGLYADKIDYLRRCGINVLCDSVIRIDEGYYIAGRNDLQGQHAQGHRRASLSELLQGTDTSAGIILLDHQPFHLEEAQRAGVDLQLSGHTHHGQLWPLNYITQAMYELSHGYMQRGRTHYYVSSGYGTWGPRVRLGSRPEVLVIDINATDEPTDD
ncbi:MAG: metallophosphoesterase [Bacteroidales bacterium]|nr:metallophosphoesterase [Bacteroidales bacterium]